MMKKIFLVIFMSIGLLTTLHIKAKELTGKLINEQGEGIANAQVSLRSFTTWTDNKGQFKLEGQDELIFSLVISKDGFYSVVQTFSSAELDNTAAFHELSIGTITLVAKFQHRTMFAFGGDVMLGRRFSQPYFGNDVLISPNSIEHDIKTIVSQMKPYLQLADYAVLNLESQIAASKPDQRAPKSVTFYSPPETLAALSWAGVDYVTLGNNHTFDYVDSGLQSTLDFLVKSRLGYSGAGVNESAALAPHIAELANSKYAMLGYVGWEGSATPSQTAAKNKGGAAHGSMSNILKSVADGVAKGYHPIVQYHGSMEYSDEPTGVTEQRLKSAIDAGAVMAIAHHPHVAQGFEVYKNKLIAYSMGNFIFDQFFYSTPHSFVLYVWMDGAKFHRAEVVPIYLQGYQPTPATAANRYTTLKRVNTLSKQRNLRLTRSGGHGVILPVSNEPVNRHIEIRKTLDNKRVVSLFDLPWQAELNNISVPKDVPYRLGVSLTNGGDFETFSSFDSHERGWLVEADHYQVKNEDNNQVLELVAAEESTWFGMQNFRRVFKPDTPSSLRVKLKSAKPFTLNVYWQGRKTRQKFFDALNSAEKHLVGSYNYTPQAWQDVVVDFNSPRIGYRSYRVLVEIVGKADSIMLDDVALIEWQTAYTQEPIPPRMNSMAEQASYIGFEQAVNGEVKLNLQQ
jgi:poly-gamma-glutamate capsule biosynthesis protein CapA/YwtB (metallophosphatase superfamily)